MPLGQWTTIHNVKFLSDNTGIICFDLPELMDVEMYLAGHGDAVGKGASAYLGVLLVRCPGLTLTIKARRQLSG